MSHQVTLSDIAQECQVSTSTVSRSLRHDQLIHPRTRARVMEVAVRMGYQGRTRGAPAIESNGRRLSVGVLLSSESVQMGQNSPNTMRYLQGISAEADATRAVLEFRAMPEIDRNQPTLDRLPAMIRHRGCRVLLLEGRHTEAEVALIAEYVPVISLSWAYEGVNIDTVVQDNVESFQTLTQRLIDAGHRRLAWVPDAYEATFFDQRQAGMLQACIHSGVALVDQVFISIDQLYCDPPRGDFAVTSRESVLAQAVEQGVTAMVCANDAVAHRVDKHLRALGWRVPEDVSLVGYDAAGPLLESGKQLASVDPQFVEMGRIGMRMAMDRIEQPSAMPRFCYIHAQIVEGETIAPPRA